MVKLFGGGSVINRASLYAFADQLGEMSKVNLLSLNVLPLVAV